MAFSSNWQDRRIRDGVIQAATGRLNLAVLGSGAIGGAALHSWAAVALGVAAYAALAAWDLASPSFWQRVIEGKKERESLPAARNVRDVEVRTAVLRIRTAREAIDRALEEAPPEVAAQVRTSLGGLDEIDSRTARLVDLAEGLTAHLSSVNEQGLREEERQLRAKSAASSDAESRTLYKEAADAREQQLAALEDVRRARERLLANLARIVSNLEGVPTRVVRMRVLDAESASGSSDEIGSEIGRMNGELAAMEQTLEVLVGERTV